MARQLYIQHRQLFIFPFAGLVLFLALLWTVVAIRLSDDKAEALASAQTSAQVLATSLAQHTTSVVHDVDLLGRLIKYEYERDPANFHLATLLGSGLVTPENAVQVTLVGHDGRIVDSSTPYTGEVDLTDRAHFAIHQTNPDAGLFISPPVFGRISRQWTIQMTRRLNGPQGLFNGVVVVSESPRIFTDGFFNTAALGPRGMVAVISRHGTILSRRTASDSLASAGPYNAATLTRSDADYGIVSDPIDGVRRIVAAAPVDEFNLVAVVGLSEADALGDLAEGRVLYLSLGVAGSLFLICFFISAIFVLTRVASESSENRMRSETDSLTRLPNRYKAIKDLRAALSETAALDPLALLFIDLNGFKHINDMHGHDIGDLALEQVGYALRAAVAEKGILYRFGGDEFAVLARGAQNELTALAENIARALDRGLTLMGETFRFPASIGIATSNQPAYTAMDILRRADLAMYAAKDAARGQESSVYRFYQEAFDEQVLKGILISQAVDEAIQREAFRFTYLPIKHASSGRVVALKVAAALAHPEFSDVDMYAQLREANAIALTERLNYHLLEAVMRDVRGTGKRMQTPVYFSFADTPGILTQPDFSEFISNLVDEYRIPAGTLHLEFAGTPTLLARPMLPRILNELKAAGVVAITTAFEADIVQWISGENALPDGVHFHPALWTPSSGDLRIIGNLVNIAQALHLAVFTSAVTSEVQVACIAPYDKAYYSGPLAGNALTIDQALRVISPL